MGYWWEGLSDDELVTRLEHRGLGAGQGRLARPSPRRRSHPRRHRPGPRLVASERSRPVRLMLTAYGMRTHALEQEAAAALADTVFAFFAALEPSEESAVRMLAAYDLAISESRHT